jgi:hypothetical protein
LWLQKKLGQQIFFTLLLLLFLDPGSGMNKIRIRDKHPGFRNTAALSFYNKDLEGLKIHFNNKKILISASLCGQQARRAWSPHPSTSRPWRRETTAAAVAAAAAASVPQDSCIIGLPSSSPAWLIAAVQLPHSGEFFKQLHDRASFLQPSLADSSCPAATLWRVL